jgi:hypothetical protein
MQGEVRQQILVVSVSLLEFARWKVFTPDRALPPLISLAPLAAKSALVLHRLREPLLQYRQEVWLHVAKSESQSHVRCGKDYMRVSFKKIRPGENLKQHVGSFLNRREFQIASVQTDFLDPGEYAAGIFWN